MTIQRKSFAIRRKQPVRKYETVCLNTFIGISGFLTPPPMQEMVSPTDKRINNYNNENGSIFEPPYL